VGGNDVGNDAYVGSCAQCITKDGLMAAIRNGLSVYGHVQGLCKTYIALGPGVTLFKVELCCLLPGGLTTATLPIFHFLDVSVPHRFVAYLAHPCSHCL
jgi:hypothetical protein